MDFSHYNMMMETSLALPSICLQNLRATGSCCARFSGFHWCKRSVWWPENAGFRSLKKNILDQGMPTLRSSIQTTQHYPSNSGVKMVSHGVQKKKRTDCGPLGTGKWSYFHPGVITLHRLHLHHRHKFLRQPPSVTCTSRWAQHGRMDLFQAPPKGNPSNNNGCVPSGKPT